MIIFDLDGTLADIRHRLHYIQEPDHLPHENEAWKPDWEAFFEACDRDRPISTTLALYRTLHDSGAKIYIFSGRSDQVRHKTRMWLSQNRIKYELLFMRRQGDHQPDHKLKKSWAHLVGVNQIHYVCDDRSRIVKMWRSLGITCYQVAEGDF